MGGLVEPAAGNACLVAGRRSVPVALAQLQTAESIGLRRVAAHAASLLGVEATGSQTELQTHEQCSDAKGVRQLDVHIQAPAPQTLAGTVNMVVTKNAKTITIHNDLQGKWVASDCGGVDAPQPVQ